MASTAAPPPTAEVGPTVSKNGSVSPPAQWPKEVVEQYEPIRRLGKGGFASVMLARKRSDNKTLVAIKVVGSAADAANREEDILRELSHQEHGYAHREVDILRELSHPNIMKVLDFWELDESKPGSCAAVMALSYNGGPTLQKLVDYGGALSLVFGRVVIAQLVDALAYCHSRAVVHRDIKPDNVVITGAALAQDELWDDVKGDAAKKEIDYWQTKCRKWHVTLLDFGFARALSPQDLDANACRKSQFSFDKSVSHAMKRTMSALGNRMYAAPEVMNDVHDEKATSSRHLTSSGRSINGTQHSFDITKTLSHHVSNYGMLADSFSLGNTIRYIMTGVPPDQKISDYIQQQNDPMVLLCKWLGKHICVSSNAASEQQRTIQYRKLHQLPDELAQLIRGTTDPSVAQRTSVRAARQFTYIEQVLDNCDASATGYDAKAKTSHQVHFLPFTLRQSKKENGAKHPATENNENDKTPIIMDNIIEEPSKDEDVAVLGLKST